MIKKNSPHWGIWVLCSIGICFVTIFVYYITTTEIFIRNSFQNLERIAFAALNPRFNNETLKNIMVGYQNTILFSSVGLCVGVYMGLFLSYFSVRFRRLRIGKVIGIFFRSSHEVVLVYIFMLIFGLNPYIAILAIGVSFGGIMGKIFTDNMNLIDNKVFYAYKNRAYNYRANFFFNLFPVSFNSNLNYIIYRYECAIRSSIVLSYVGLPGIGFYINISLNDGDYNALFAYIYSLVVFVLFFSILTTFLLKKIQYKLAALLKVFIPLSFVLCMGFIALHNNEFWGLFHGKNVSGLIRSYYAILDILNPFNQDFYNAQNMARFFRYTWQTVALGIVATVFLLIMFALLMFHYFYGFTKSSKFHLKLNSAVSIINRSIPEVIFLTLLLFVMKPSIISGALALALHNFGILSKLVVDRIASDYNKVFRAYKNRGYTCLTMFFFVFLPVLSRDLVSLVSYRFEMMIKGSVVIGILGSGGLGYLLRLEMSRFNFKAIFFIVFLYVALFLVLDRISEAVSYGSLDNGCA